MNKVVIGIIATLVLATGTLFIVNGSGDDAGTDTANNQSTSTPSSSSDPASPASADSNEVPGEGAYVTYSENAIADASGTNRVLFFHATWCSVCNFYEGQIEEQGVPAGVTVIKADFDNDTALKEQYNVNVQSTFVLLDDNGDIVQTWPFASGLRDIQDLYEAVI